MGIVAAGVHAAVCRGEGKTCLFLYGQAVHVSPDGKDGLFPFSLEERRHAVPAEPLPVGDAHPVKFGADVGLRQGRVHSGLGNPVQISSPLYDLMVHFLRCSPKIHYLISSFLQSSNNACCAVQ